MSDIILFQSIERCTIIVALKALHSEKAIPRFLRIVRSLVVKITKELGLIDGEPVSPVKHQTHVQDPHTFRTYNVL